MYDLIYNAQMSSSLPVHINQGDCADFESSTPETDISGNTFATIGYSGLPHQQIAHFGSIYTIKYHHADVAYHSENMVL